MKLLLFLSFLIVFDFALAEEPSKCEAKLKPLSTPWPKYPSPEQAKDYLQGTEYAHVFVKGSVRVRFTVSIEGIEIKTATI